VDQLVTDVKSAHLIIVAAWLMSVAALTPAAALAHAFPVTEQPRVGSTINAPPSEVTITYDAPIESLFATLHVLDGSGNDESTGTPEVDPTRHLLSIKVRPLAPGDYTVQWAVVAEDGHRTEGSYMFTVVGKASG